MTIKSDAAYRMPPGGGGLVRGSMPDQVQMAAYSINGFCAAHSISRGMFYKMEQAGKGPRIMKVGTRTLITIEAAADWRREREAESNHAYPVYTYSLQG